MNHKQKANFRRELENDRQTLLELFRDDDCGECGKHDWKAHVDGSQRKGLYVLCGACGANPTMPPPFGAD